MGSWPRAGEGRPVPEATVAPHHAPASQAGSPETDKVWGDQNSRKRLDVGGERRLLGQNPLTGRGSWAAPLQGGGGGGDNLFTCPESTILQSRAQMTFFVHRQRYFMFAFCHEES